MCYFLIKGFYGVLTPACLVREVSRWRPLLVRAPGRLARGRRRFGATAPSTVLVDVGAGAASHAVAAVGDWWRHVHAEVARVALMLVVVARATTPSMVATIARHAHAASAAPSTPAPAPTTSTAH